MQRDKPSDIPEIGSQQESSDLLLATTGQRRPLIKHKAAERKQGFFTMLFTTATTGEPVSPKASASYAKNSGWLSHHLDGYTSLF